LTEIGATGDWPQGKLNEDDEGGLAVEISTVGANVRVDFGKPVAWLAMDPDGALALASGIIEHAMRIKLRGLALLAEAFGETKQ
jgi:hypothetical protein